MPISMCNSWPFGVQLMAFRSATHGLSMRDSCPFGVQLMAFRCAIHALSECNSCPFDVRFMPFRCAIHALSVCDLWLFNVRFTAIRKRSVASRHSAEKRNPGFTARQAYHLDAFRIPLFSGMTRLLSPNKKSSAPESSRSKGAAI